MRVAEVGVPILVDLPVGSDVELVADVCRVSARVGADDAAGEIVDGVIRVLTPVGVVCRGQRDRLREMQVNAGVGYRLSKSLSVMTTVGKIASLKGDFKAKVLGVSLGYQFTGFAEK